VAAAPAQVKEWIAEATKVLEANGVPASEINEQALWIIIQHESGGNPDAINLTDSNAAAGDPSKGLMQTISTTFGAYSLPGHGNIYDPVDNIIAGTRYALSRYGSLSNVPGVRAVESGGSYVGY
jgi:SLT domain-containing protein